MMEKTTENIRFNKLRKRLPHRYTNLVAKRAGNTTPVQVKLIFEGRITDPEKIETVYKAAMKVAAMHERTRKLVSPKYRKNVKP